MIFNVVVLNFQNSEHYSLCDIINTAGGICSYFVFLIIHRIGSEPAVKATHIMLVGFGRKNCINFGLISDPSYTSDIFTAGMT